MTTIFEEEVACAVCGYVAPELATAADGAGRIVASADYRAELERKGRSRLANRFVCRSLLEKRKSGLLRPVGSTATAN